MDVRFLDVELRDLDESRIAGQDSGVQPIGRDDGRTGLRLGLLGRRYRLASSNGDMSVGNRLLESRFDTIGWGLLFLLFGAVAMPMGTAAYASIAAVGGLMVGLNAARVIAGVAVRWFSAILGTALFVAGCGALAGLHMDAFVLFFALAGAVTIVGALVRPVRAVAQ
jgi:hypothetical protein